MVAKRGKDRKGLMNNKEDSWWGDETSAYAVGMGLQGKAATGAFWKESG